MGNMVGHTEDQLREQIRPDAERGLVERVVLVEFTRAEGVTLGDSEMTDELRSLATSVSNTYGESAAQVMEQLRAGGVFGSVLGDAVLRKAAGKLTAMLTGREDEWEAEHQSDQDQSEAGDSESEEDSGKAESDEEQAPASSDASEAQEQIEGDRDEGGTGQDQGQS